jgi:hypothetical protein
MVKSGRSADEKAKVHDIGKYPKTLGNYPSCRMLDDGCSIKPKEYHFLVLDIRGFTGTFQACEAKRLRAVTDENSAREENVEDDYNLIWIFLQDFYSRVCKIISDNGGKVNKIVGDGLFGVFQKLNIDEGNLSGATPSTHMPVAVSAERVLLAAHQIMDEYRYLRKFEPLQQNLWVIFGSGKLPNT